MDEFKFNSINELYNRLLPAMETKKNDLLRNTKVLISEQEIWGYFRSNYWNKKSKLTLGEMVNDILSTPDHELIDYHNLNTK